MRRAIWPARDLKVLAGAKEKNEHYRREVRHVPRQLDGTKNKKWSCKEAGKNKGIESRHDAKNKNEAEKRLNRPGRKHEEIISIS